ncbi:MAG: DMT family transporter [Lachnospiraceae bacterium]|nr:DMT family transporter [Lachnospiraceae bacterium]
MKKWLGIIMLFLTAFIWGTAFVAQSVGMDYVGPFTFNFARYLVGSLVLVPFVIFNFSSKKKTKQNETGGSDTKKYMKYTVFGGIGCGILLCIASSLQQFGIMYSKAVGKAGFLTALYIILVPVIGLFFKKKVSALIWVCVVLATIGLYLICVKEGFVFEIGDIFLILCALVFSFHIMFIDYVSPKGDGVTISCIQFLVAGILCLICAVFTEKIVIRDIIKGYIPILYAGVMSCGVAYTFQILGQKYVEPTKASLILCLESVFATLGGWVILHEVLTIKEMIGCVIVFIAIILAQFVQKTTKTETETAY